jgi:hypothetical protein
MNSKEKEDKRVKTVKVTPKLGQVSIKNPLEPDADPKSFTFDAVYDWDCRQRDVYDETAHPLIEQVLEGYNGTIFAYGQTGCGKSFTMMGLVEPPEMVRSSPVIPRPLAIMRAADAGPAGGGAARHHPQRFRPHLQPHLRRAEEGVPHPCAPFPALVLCACADALTLAQAPRTWKFTTRRSATCCRRTRRTVWS